MILEKKTIENVVVECSKKIEHKLYEGENVINVICPSIIFYFGKDTQENKEIIKNILDKNWINSSRYIFHFGVECSDEKVLIKNLCDDSSSIECTAEDFLDDGIMREILSAPIGTFKDYKSLRVRFVIQGSDEHFNSYFDFANRITTQLVQKIYKDIFILIDEGEIAAKRAIREKMFKKLYDFEKDKKHLFNQVFFLSNRFKNNNFLEEREYYTNYRIIANSILMMDSNTEDNKISAFYNDEKIYRALSYKYLKKPCYEIVCVIFKTIISNIINIKAKDKNTIDKMFAEEQFEEEYFDNNFKDLFPSFEDFKLLPFHDGSQKNLINKANSNSEDNFSNIKISQIDSATYGCFSEFYKLNYENVIDENFNEEHFKNELIKKFTKKYSYIDILTHFQYENIINIACKEGRITPTNDANIYKVFERYCYYKARNYFLQKMRTAYKNAIEELTENSKVFSEIVHCAKQLLNGMYVSSDKGIKQSVSEYYAKLTEEEYLSQIENIFDYLGIHITSGDLFVSSIINLFDKIRKIDINGILTAGLMEELTNRLNSTNSIGEKNNLICNELQSEMSNFTRINVAQDYLEQMYETYLFCDDNNIIDRNVKNANLEFITTNDKNIFERLIMYRFDSASQILGSTRTEEIV